MRIFSYTMPVFLITLLISTSLCAMGQDGTLEQDATSWEFVGFETSNEIPVCPVNSPAAIAINPITTQKAESTFCRQLAGLSQQTAQLPNHEQLLQLFTEYNLQELFIGNSVIDDLAEQTAAAYDVYTHVAMKNWDYFHNAESCEYEQSTALRKRFHIMLVQLFLQASSPMDSQTNNTDA